MAGSRVWTVKASVVLPQHHQGGSRRHFHSSIRVREEASHSKEVGSTADYLDPTTVLTLRSDKDPTRVYYVVGTSHISDASVEQVRKAIRALKPRSVMVELCENRYKNLNHKKTDFFSGGGILSSLFPSYLSKITKHLPKFAEILNNKNHGAELKAAVDEAHAINAQLVLGDRPAEETMNLLRQQLLNPQMLLRLSSLNMSMAPPALIDIARKIMDDSVTDADFESLKKPANITALSDFIRSVAPEAMQALLDDRDAFLVQNLKTCRGPVTVAVVGLMHLKGIGKLWKEGSQDTETLVKLLGPPTHD
eukprot:TRINITY_DN5052_c0_g1_i3.p1 TRINITY_DN5052_c0_g1~~TRINITY_DN5052_c0_g1_i3.p1  ORF type:complete len:352 (+),score=47.37 TRINITY_DN5052_c0_g1_i3:138-1058(+)